MKSENVMGIVRKFHERKLTMSWDLLKYSLIFIVVIIVFKVTLYILKYQENDDFSVKYIYKIFLALSGNTNFKKLQLKILFLSLASFSFFFASDFFMNLTALKYQSNTKLLINEFEEVLDKNLSVYVIADEEAMKIYREKSYFNKNIKQIMTNAKYFNFMDDVSKKEYDSGVVTAISSVASFIISRKKDDSKEYVLMETNMPPIFIVLYFEQNSPYIIKYNRVMNRFYETGLVRRGLVKEKDFDDFQVEDDDNALIFTLCTVFVIGFLTATLVLVFECIIHKTLYGQMYRRRIRHRILHRRARLAWI